MSFPVRCTRSPSSTAVPTVLPSGVPGGPGLQPEHRHRLSGLTVNGEPQSSTVASSSTEARRGLITLKSMNSLLLRAMGGHCLRQGAGGQEREDPCCTGHIPLGGRIFFQFMFFSFVPLFLPGPGPAGMCKICHAPAWSNGGGLFRIYDEPVSPNGEGLIGGACLRCMMNRNRQMRGRVQKGFRVHAQHASKWDWLADLQCIVMCAVSRVALRVHVACSSAEAFITFCMLGYLLHVRP